MTASADELREALRSSLEQRGVLGDMRARLRAEIFKAIDTNDDTPQRMPIETVVACDVFRDFLRFAGYSQTLSVFEAEAALGDELTREALARDLGVVDDMPVVYSLVEAAKRGRRDKALGD